MMQRPLGEDLPNLTPLIGACIVSYVDVEGYSWLQKGREDFEEDCNQRGIGCSSVGR